MSTESNEPESVKLPFRIGGLDGFSTSHGYTFDGGSFHGGGPHSPQSVSARLRLEYGRPATVSLDLTDDRGGRAVTLNPEQARALAAALVAGADEADADMAHWRGIVERQRADILAADQRDALGRAGLAGADA